LGQNQKEEQTLQTTHVKGRTTHSFESVGVVGVVGIFAGVKKRGQKGE
jgi:hypothetical protein